jgi:hypothetical protein
MSKCSDGQVRTKRGSWHRKLDAAGWGLFFIWTGLAFLMDVGWGAGLLGVGIITLGGQATRRYLGLELEGFWIVVGFLFLLRGIWRISNVELGLLPILFVVAGIVLLASIVGRANNSGLSDRC